VNAERYLTARARLIEHALRRYVPPQRKHPRKLSEAMRYSLFSGGKRIRPILLLAAAEAVGGERAAAMPFACAVEMIHTYSLIHDDLPAMDDDVLRRGRPTNHLVFGDGIAILAGDALLTDAFHIMAAELAHRTRGGRAAAALKEIAEAAGSAGMVGGQAADLEAEGAEPNLPVVEYIHVRKTGALLVACIRAGAILGSARPNALRQLTRFGEFFGLAFQVADDILDAEAGVAVTGKTPGRDRARRKLTFPAVLGLPAAKERARGLLANALAALDPLKAPAEPLRAIARYVVARGCDGRPA